VLAHKLHGTAGSYGFPEVGEAARRIEAAVRTVEGTPGEDHTAAWGEVWTSLREAEALALAAREREGSPASGGGRVRT
jgi:HPt (histidine-containing phosphotransfer) domain-containing protein